MSQKVFSLGFSAEFVDEIRLRQVTKYVMQDDLSTMIGVKAEGFSGSQFCSGIKTLHNTAGKLQPLPI